MADARAHVHSARHLRALLEFLIDSEELDASWRPVLEPLVTEAGSMLGHRLRDRWAAAAETESSLRDTEALWSPGTLSLKCAFTLAQVRFARIFCIAPQSALPLSEFVLQ